MEIKEAYNQWAEQYDTNHNKTRDLEGSVLIKELAQLNSNSCLEIGCGTGKNTVFLAQKAKKVLAVDFSEEMLAKAKAKIQSQNVTFKQIDVLKDWNFEGEQFDLIIFSLVLEHVQDLNAIFKKVADVLTSNGQVYIGELHPFKQYSGSKARFDTDNTTQVLTCYTHHISDFVQAALDNKLVVSSINEYFDENDRSKLPRILTVLLCKS